MSESTDNGIVYPKTAQYLNNFNGFSDNRLNRLEQIALDAGEPIVNHSSAQLIMTLVRQKQPARILEIGTNIGFSASCMAIAANRPLQIDSIEFDPERARQAREWFATERFPVTVHEMPALTYLDSLTNTDMFDLVFIDANKRENKHYVEGIEDHLTLHALVIVDNVLWYGRVSGQRQIDDRQLKSTSAIREFNDWMMRHSKFNTVIYPIGDGLMIAEYVG